MNNFLKLINVLLAALKPEDKEKYEKIQLDAETIFKVKSRYDHLFGKDDRVYIEDERLNNVSLSISAEHIKNIKNINNLFLEHKYDYKILSKTDYLAGKATKNGSTDSIKTARNSESIEKLLTNIINNVIKNEYEPFLEEREFYIKDKEVLNIINDNELKISQKIFKMYDYYFDIDLANIKNIKPSNYRLQEIVVKLYYPMKYRSLYSMRPSLKNNNLSVVISRKAEDIAGMSTDRRWTSCMRLPGYGDENGGLYNDILYYDVKLGTLVAYLIKKDDRNIENPLARIAIKPLFNLDDDIADILDALDIQSIEYLNKDNLKAIEDFKKKEITIFLRPEENIYSDGSLSTEIKTNFKRIVNDFCEKNNKNVEGMYFLNRRLYNDSAKESEITLKNKNHKEYINNLITNLKYNYEILNDSSINLEKSLLEWYFYNNKDINNWFFKALKDNNIKYISLIDYKRLKASFLKNANVEDKKLDLILDVCENCNFKNVEYITIYEESRNCTFDTCTIICGKYKNCTFINCEFSQNIDVFSEKYKDFVRCAVNTEQFLQAEKYSSSLEDLRNTIKKKLLK